MDTAAVGFEEGYRRFRLRKVLFIVLCVIAVVALCGVACLVDGRPIGFLDVYRIIWEHLCGAQYDYGTTEYWDDYIVWNTRLPRIAMAILAGASLSTCGVVMQSIMSNPLADPYTTGISSGASFGAIVAIAIGFSFSSVLGQSGIVGNAFVMALVPALIVIVLSRFMYTSPATLILIGTAVSYLFGSLNTLVLVYADEETMATAYLWQIGSFDNTMWSELQIPLVVTVLGCAAMMVLSRKLNVMMMGDDEARALGLDVENFRTVCLVVMSVMVAAIISYTGILGFVGLVAPHIVRMVIGSDNTYIMPASMAFGAALLLFTDLLARIVVHPSEIPAGIILMMIGGPLFLYLIVRKKGYGGVY